MCLFPQDQAYGRHERVPTECGDWAAQYEWQEEMDTTTYLHVLWGKSSLKLDNVSMILQQFEYPSIHIQI